MTPERRTFLESLQPMDVVRLNGRLRVIRKIERHKQWRPAPQHPQRIYFWFSIVRCSWTHRPYTVKTMTDLAHVDIELVMRNYTPKSELEWQLQKDIQARTHKPCLDCCDVKGIS